MRELNAAAPAAASQETVESQERQRGQRSYKKPASPAPQPLPTGRQRTLHPASRGERILSEIPPRRRKGGDDDDEEEEKMKNQARITEKTKTNEQKKHDAHASTLGPTHGCAYGAAL